MKVSKEKIKSLSPCAEGYAWYLKNQETDVRKLLLSTNEVNPSWANWLFSNLMNRKQRIEIAIYAATLVLPIFESAYPNDKRPRAAIAAAKAVLKNDTKENRDASYAAATAYAAYAAYAAAAAASYAAAAAKKQVQEKIILKAIRILEEGDK